VTAERWEQVDFPLLHEIAAREQGQTTVPTVGDLAAAIGADPQIVAVELERLIAARYLLGRLIKMATPDPRPFRLDAVLGERGARAVQLWPADGATSVSLLLEVLNERADAEPDPERQGRLRRAASAAEDVGTDILAKTITEFLARVAGAP